MKNLFLNTAIEEFEEYFYKVNDGKDILELTDGIWDSIRDRLVNQYVIDELLFHHFTTEDETLDDLIEEYTENGKAEYWGQGRDEIEKKATHIEIRGLINYYQDLALEYKTKWEQIQEFGKYTD